MASQHETFASFEEWFEVITDRFSVFLLGGEEVDPSTVDGDLSDFWIDESTAGFFLDHLSYVYECK